MFESLFGCFLIERRRHEENALAPPLLLLLLLLPSGGVAQRSFSPRETWKKKKETVDNVVNDDEW
jgi:hypothetical protein